MNQHLLNSWTTLLARIRPYVHPPHPGRGKNILVGVLIGLVLGPIGVGLHLRSLYDFFMIAMVATLATMLLPGRDELVVGIVAALWAATRIVRDTHGPHDSQGPGAAVENPKPPDDHEARKDEPLFEDESTPA